MTAMYLKATVAGSALCFVSLIVFLGSYILPNISRQVQTGPGSLQAITIQNHAFWSLAVASFAFGFFIVVRFFWR
jgi:hypothetical protein